ncbi:MAG: hypothetical protein ACHP7K_05015 [Actinomycetales bacterium]
MSTARTESGTAVDIGRSIPGWYLNAAGFLLAFGMSAPQWDNTFMIVVPVAVYLACAFRPGTIPTLLSLGLVLLSVAVGQQSVGLWTFLLAAGIHLLFLLYGLTGQLQWNSRVSLPALRLVGGRFLLWQIPVQLLAVLALLTRHGGSSLLMTFIGAAAAAGVALLWVRAKRP